MLGVWGGRPGLPVPIELREKSELRSCVKVEGGRPGLPVPIELREKSELRSCVKVEGGRPGLPVPKSPNGLCECKANFGEKQKKIRAQELCASRGGRPGLPVSSSPYGTYGRKATLKLNLGEEEEKWCTVQVSQVAGHSRKRGAVALAGQGRESPR